MCGSGQAEAAIFRRKWLYLSAILALREVEVCPDRVVVEDEWKTQSPKRRVKNPVPEGMA